MWKRRGNTSNNCIMRMIEVIEDATDPTRPSPLGEYEDIDYYFHHADSFFFKQYHRFLGDTKCE